MRIRVKPSETISTLPCSALVSWIRAAPRDYARPSSGGSDVDRRPSKAWLELKRSTGVPLLAGENAARVGGFRPYLDNQVLDMIHSDFAYCAGIMGCRKIGEYASLSRAPMGLRRRAPHTHSLLCVPCMRAL